MNILKLILLFGNFFILNIKVQHELAWVNERAGGALLDISFMADSNEIVAVFSNGVVLTVSVDSKQVS